MVKGLKKISRSEILVSVTGVAGPDGGSSKTQLAVFILMGTKIKINIIIQQLKKFLEKERGKKFKKRALNSY